MNTQEYRIALISFKGSSKKYAYLCDDKNINVGDFVLVEGQNEVVQVLQIKFVDTETSPFPVMAKSSSTLIVVLRSGGNIIRGNCNISFSKYAVLRIELCGCPIAICGSIFE